MLSLDVKAALASTITPSKGIADQELTGLGTSMRRYIDSWLKERQGGDHAWSMDPYEKRTIELTKDVAKYAQSEGIRTVVWIGIGGSGLGPKVIQEFLETPDTVEFIVLDTLDPAVLSMYMDLIDWKHTLVVIASKSGGTLEPMSIFFLCRERLKKALGDKANDHIVAITDPHKGTLRTFCLEEGIQMLPIPSGVGGRFSIFTPIGLLPIALLNGNVDQFVRGAKEMDTMCQTNDVNTNPAAMLAAMQFLLETKRGYNIRVIMPYSQRLSSMGRWNQQLIAESLGKDEVHNPIPLAAVGSQDQHSLLQQWMQGPRNSWHLFIREKSSVSLKVPTDVEQSFDYIAGKEFMELLDACYQGTSQALTNHKRPNITISVDKLDEYHLGQIFFLLLTEVVLLGRLYRIDPYGQPGVEASKVITKQLLGGNK